MSELLLRSPLAPAELVRAGELSATELVETSLRRIDELEPLIGAFTHIAHDRAVAEAAAVQAGDERPFAGVPIAIKDNRAVAGLPLAVGRTCSERGGVYREGTALERAVFPGERLSPRHMVRVHAGVRVQILTEGEPVTGLSDPCKAALNEIRAAMEPTV